MIYLQFVTLWMPYSVDGAMQYITLIFGSLISDSVGVYLPRSLMFLARLMMRTGALITNYESWNLARRSVEELLCWSASSLAAILVIDDASTTKSNIPLHPLVSVRVNAINIGYVKSVNIGMSMLDNCDLVILLDSDAYPLMDLVPTAIAKFTANPELGAIAMHESSPGAKCRISGTTEPTVVQFILGQLLTSKFLNFHVFGSNRFVAHSCCLVIRKAAFDAVRGFDEEFDFLDADTDFSMRLTNAGWTVAPDYTLKCFHQGSGSPQAVSKRVIRFHRNRFLLLTKHRKFYCHGTVKIALSIRHIIEIIVLAMGWLIVKPAARASIADKLSCRILLLKRVWHSYNAT